AWSVQSPPAGMLAALTARIAPAPAAPSPAAPRASAVFSEQVLQDLVVEGLLSDEPLEPAVLFFQDLQPRRLTPVKATVLLLPSIEGLLADAVLAAEHCCRCARLMLFQHADDLLLRKPAATHPVLLGTNSRRGLSVSVDQFSGGRSFR